MERKLEGKVAIITGASKGIGEGIAKTFVRYGAKVVLAARGEKVLALAEALRSEGYEATGVQTDVSNEASVEKLVQTAVSTYGTVDILVNNAGICTLEDFDDEPRPRAVTQEEYTLLEKYRTLDPTAQEIVRFVIEKEAERAGALRARATH